MVPYSIPSLVSSILIFIPFYYILSNWKNSLSTKLLSILIVELWVYLISEFSLINAHTPALALFWIKILYLALSLIPATFLQITLSYPETSSVPINRNFIISIYLPALFLISLLPTPYFIQGVQTEYWGYGKIAGPAYNLLRVYLVLYFIVSASIIFKKFRNSEDLRTKNSLGFLGISCIFPMGLSAFIMAILQPLNINKLNIIAPSLSINCFSFLFTYAVVKYRVFDLQLLFSPMIKTNKYHFHQSLKRLIKELPNVPSYEKIVSSLSTLFACDVSLNVKGKMVAAVGGDQSFRNFQLENEYDLLEKRDKNLERYRIYLADELKGKHDRFYRALEHNGIEMLIPLRSQNRLIGIIKFGEGFSKNVYSTQDFNLITNLYEQLLIAINHISIMDERLKVKEKQLEILKKQIRTFRSSPSKASCPYSEYTKPFTLNHEGVEFNKITTYYYGKDQKLRGHFQFQFHQVEDIKIDNTSLDESDVIIIDARIMDDSLYPLFKMNKPFLIITDQKGTRKKIGEICPTNLKVFLDQKDIDANFLSACRALWAVKKAVLYEDNGQKLISRCPYIIELLPQIHAAASKADCILITGDSGTGKELLASYISHFNQKEKYLPVNCATIPEMLFESEFFGHAKGAFTGAVHNHRGLLEKARGGFLFLDEIGELPLNVQAKFLRILEGSSFESIGGNGFIHPDVRYIASTNQDLEEMVRRGQFRPDLFFRLNQVHFHLPPLNHRKEDIPILAFYFLCKFNAKYGKDCRLSDSYIRKLQQHPWKGHIRELSNMIHQDVLAAGEGRIIKRSVHRKNEDNVPPNFVEQVQEYEKKLIIEALSHCGSQRAAANYLNLPISTLHSKIKKYGLQDT